MSQKSEKRARRALERYDKIVLDVEQSVLRSERALEIVMAQAAHDANERAGVERRLRKELRREREQRRNAGRVARWALAVAVVDLFAMVGLAVAVLL